MAYQTVIAVRYPGLVHVEDGVVSYGMYFTADVQQAGGFLPIVWDAPGTDMEAADAVSVVTKYIRTLFDFGPDAADSLTVLHNRTNMVRRTREGRPAPAVSLVVLEALPSSRWWRKPVEAF